MQKKYFFLAQVLVTEGPAQQQKTDGVIASSMAEAASKLATHYEGKTYDVLAVQKGGEVTVE